MSRLLEYYWGKRALNLPFENQYEALILASIIEKETQLPSERREIAGVFVRRLLGNIRLQTDPTVIYGLGEKFNGNLTKKDLQRASPYNTYHYQGLPPTPISMPGEGALAAVVDPAPGASLYFVAKGDGSHHFSTSLKAHNAAVLKYQIKSEQDKSVHGKHLHR